MTETQQKLKRLKERLDRMRDDYNELCKAAFPVGTPVSYLHGDQLRFGRVVDVGYGHRIKIQGVTTAYWIDAYRLIETL
jgi:hypothetical protein